MSQEPQPRAASVAAVIPTRENPELLLAAVRSALACSAGMLKEIVIVEQGDGSGWARLESEGILMTPGVPKMLHLPTDNGRSFSAMCNAGAAASTAPYLLMLNDDTECRPDFLSHMMDALDQHEDVGIVGAKLVYPTGAIQHVGVALKSSDGTPYHIGYRRADDGTYEPAMRDDFYLAATFACVLIRRQTWAQVGGLDEAYHFNYEDADFCLAALERGWKTFVTCRAVVVHHEGASERHRTTEDHTVQRNWEVYQNKWVKSGRLEQVAGIRLDHRRCTPKPDRLNIAFLSSGKEAGVPWWRLELPARKMSQLGLANVEVVYPGQDLQHMMTVLEEADVAVTHCYASEMMLLLARLGGSRPCAFVYDCDDHPLYISPFAEVYRRFGCSEIRMKDPAGQDVWMWRDGESGFDIARNMANRQKQFDTMAAADMVTTTTPPLLAYLRGINHQTVMLPNSIDFDLFRALDGIYQRRPGPVRIGWHGGDNHWHDVSEIGRPLVEYVNSHNVQLVLFGAHYRGPLRGIDRNKVVEEQWANVEAFPYKLATLGIDIAVIPLGDPRHPLLAANAMKSAIKYMEYASLKIPCLVSANRAAYAMCVDDENSMTFSSDEEFTAKLHRLCKDASVRKRIGEAGYDWTYKHANLETNAVRWVEAYQRAVEMHLEVVKETWAPLREGKAEVTEGAQA